MAGEVYTHHLIYDRFYNRFKEKLSQPANITTLKKVYNYIYNQNAEALASTIPDKRLYVNPKSEDEIYRMLGLNKGEIKQAIIDTPDLNSEHKTIQTEMYTILILMAIVFFKNNKNELRDQTMLIANIYFYKNVRSHYFKFRTTDNYINCMNYTVANLSYKSDLKKYKSIGGMINKKNEVFIENWFIKSENKKKLTGIVLDHDFQRIINDLNRRYSTTINTFYAEYDKNLKSGKYLNVDKDIDEEGNYMESDNVSFLVKKTTDSLMIKHSLSIYPDQQIISFVTNNIKGCQCTMNNLKMMINDLYDNEKDFEKIVSLILQIYFFDYKMKLEDIRSNYFIECMLKHYKGLSEKDKNLVEIKEIVNKYWENSTFAKSKKQHRDGTVNSYKKAIFAYMVMFIRKNV